MPCCTRMAGWIRTSFLAFASESVLVMESQAYGMALLSAEDVIDLEEVEDSDPEAEEENLFGAMSVHQRGGLHLAREQSLKLPSKPEPQKK